MTNKPYTDFQKTEKKKVTLIVATVGSLFSLLLIVLLFALSDDEVTEIVKSDNEDIIDLLNESQLSKSGSDDNQIGIELPQGGWVQQTDEVGNLVQQYRCSSLNPNPMNLPSGWIEMDSPEIELYLSENRLVRITGEHGIANAPKRVLESGEIAGQVVVAMYELSDWSANAVNASPTMVLTTPQISFDNFIGEITCESEIRIQTVNSTLSGRKLAIRFNDTEGRIEHLRLAEVDYIDLYNIDRQLPPSAPVRKTLAVTNTQEHPSKKVQASILPEVEHYLITLSDHVVITQGDPLTGRKATGDKLTIAFSKNSEPSAQTAQHTQTITPFASLESNIASLSLGGVANRVFDETVTRITCESALVMVPLYDEELYPLTEDDTRIELFGTAELPVKMTDEQQEMTALGTHFRHDINADRSEISGSPALLTQRTVEFASSHIWIDNSNHVGGSPTSGTMKNSDGTGVSSTLSWGGSVDFTFNQESEVSTLRTVLCKGDVRLTDPESTLSCDSLEVNFELNASGNSIPSLAIASDDVVAVSDTQTLWANKATVTFAETQDDASGELLGSATAETMTATGDVQVLLEDGGRAFCDNLQGDVSQEKATLTGNVVVAYDQLLMNRGEEAIFTINRLTGKGHWNGAGQALFLTEPINVSKPEKISRPAIQSSNDSAPSSGITMRANWYHDMELDQHFNDGAGALTLGGEVDIRSSQSPQDVSQMTGDELRLEFEIPRESEHENRELERVIAKNNAQIEHRVWEDVDKTTPPIVYYIGGDHIEYVPKTQETLAVGHGELVLRDPRQPKVEEHQSALAGKGTTRFTWSQKLQTLQLSKELYRIHMNGDVEMVHKNLQGHVGMLTADELEGIAADPMPEKGSESVSELTMRGMDLKQIKAGGNVYVATDSRRVDCDTFDYNLQTGLARLSADKGKQVAIVTEGVNYPVRAESILWNMDPEIDSITIKNLQGRGSN